MTGTTAERRVRKLVDSPRNHCFVCSQTNPFGLQLRFDDHDGVTRAAFVPGIWHEGWQEVVHGGILAALLDEAMAYTLFFRGVQGLTARMEVRYRAPAYPGDALSVEARQTRDTRRLVDVEARILRGDDVVAEALGRYMKIGALEADEAEGRSG
ncbi:MAG: PaaI family thioesterase [Chloroflexi bacterium]|nr:PaaI family thioesterase [Chloroflexota bacterium]